MAKSLTQAIRDNQRFHKYERMLGESGFAFSITKTRGSSTRPNGSSHGSSRSATDLGKESKAARGEDARPPAVVVGP